MTKKYNPPRIPKWILQRLKDYQDSYSIAGDLEIDGNRKVFELSFATVDYNFQSLHSEISPLALVCQSCQSIKTAMANPVTSLRYE